MCVCSFGVIPLTNQHARVVFEGNNYMCTWVACVVYLPMQRAISCMMGGKCAGGFCDGTEKGIV